MLKIGEFAALAQISIRMLRHYDEMGLLKPIRVDPETGYRYYDYDQLARLNCILALKDLGLSLEEIGLLLDGALNADEIRGMLKLKQAQLRQQLLAETARLNRVENRLRYIEAEGRLPDGEVVIKAQPALHVISLAGSGYPGQVFAEAFAVLKRHGLAQHIHGALTLYPGSLDYQRTGQRTSSFHCEAAFIVDETVQASVPVTAERELRVWDVPAQAQVASLVSTKPDHERALDAQALWGWMHLHHYRLTAPTRELYLRRPCETQSGLTELIFPIEVIQQEK